MIVVGIIMTIAGVFMIIKTEWLLNNFGRITWFEDKLGSDGGSRLGYKLLGMIVVFIGIIFATGSGSDFMQWVVSPLTKHTQRLEN